VRTMSSLESGGEVCSEFSGGYADYCFTRVRES
jgi:hypothetical protein